MSHPLNRSIWSALASRQAAFDPPGSLARRFPADVSPLSAARDFSPEALAALAATMAPGEDIALLEAVAPKPPAGIVTTDALLYQMVAPALTAGGRDVAMAPLGDDDAAEMLELATLTRPGPFRARTHTLGRFVGVRDGGRLVAMAGERLHVDGFHEISAVCTHPDFRGRGLGAALMRAVGARMLAEGETPFLHTYASNAMAIALYRKLGFEVRAEITYSMWKRA